MAAAKPYPQAKTAVRRWVAVTGVALAFACGCSTTSTPAPESNLAGPGSPYLVNQYGKVVRVNMADRYVILECAVLPKEGERITLLRGNEPVGVVRVTWHKAGRHAAADIEEGFPMTGDRFRGDRRAGP
jgi:hypothetical protein